MKPPHANPAHPMHAHYNPATDDYPMCEAINEREWRATKGIDPRTGHMWLTPRMERNAVGMTRSLLSHKHARIT